MYGLEEVRNGWFSSPRTQGAMQLLSGITEIGTTAAVTTGTSGAASFLAWPLLAHGVDNALAGGYSLITGRSRQAATVTTLGNIGVPNSTAHAINDGLGLFGNIAGAEVVQAGRALSYMGRYSCFQRASVAPRVEYQSIQRATPQTSISQTTRQTLSTGKQNLTPSNFFKSKTYTEFQSCFTTKFGIPRPEAPGGLSFFNSKTGRMFHLHQQPGHVGGKPHVDIRRRSAYQERKYLLKD